MTGPTAAARASVAESFAAATKRAPVGRHAGAAALNDVAGQEVPAAVHDAAVREVPVAAQEIAGEEAARAAAEPDSGRVDPPTLLHPATYLCANCAGRFPARTRPTPYCSPQCTAEAKAVRYARRQRAEHGDDLPSAARVLLLRKVVHAILECGYDKWSGQPEPDPVTPPSVHPLAEYVDPMIPATDSYARKAQELMVRSLSENVLLACDHQNWDAVWRAWVNLHAR